MVNRGYYTSLYDAAQGRKAAPLPLAKSEEWLARSGRVIPGGAQTYSKSWRQHIRGVSPLFLERGAGAWVWDVDGNRYVDLIQGLLPNILGYAHPDVDRAAGWSSPLVRRRGGRPRAGAGDLDCARPARAGSP